MKKLIPFLLATAIFKMPDGPAPFKDMHIECDADKKICEWECNGASDNVTHAKMVNGECKDVAETVGCEPEIIFWEDGTKKYAK